MSDVRQHHAQAEHNLKFSNGVSENYADWTIVALYYTAVHRVRAYLASRGAYTPNTHVDLKELLERVGFDRRLLLLYRTLETLSRDARYNCFPPDDLKPDIKRAKSILAALEAWISPRIQGQL